MKYNVKITNDLICEITKPSSSTIIYKIPYDILKQQKKNIRLENRFIVYILLGKNIYGLDYIYVGKSKNGIDQRPTAHEDKAVWDTCYVMTSLSKNSFLNDGTIQCIEDIINKHIDSLKKFTNTTLITTPDTANDNEKEDCIEFIQTCLTMLYVMGLDLITKNKAQTDTCDMDFEGNYYNDIYDIAYNDIE